jgi:hypothetical protein
MSISDSLERKEKKAMRKIAHPAIGEISCLNEAEADLEFSMASKPRIGIESDK